MPRLETKFSGATNANVPTVTIPHHNQMTKIELSSQSTINAIAVLRATSGGNMAGKNNFLNVRFHTTVATAATVDNELSLIGNSYIYPCKSKLWCAGARCGEIQLQVHLLFHSLPCILIGYNYILRLGIKGFRY